MLSNDTSRIFILVIIGLIVGIIIGFWLAVFLFLKNEIWVALIGKKIAVLGDKATGKTTLLKYMNSGILPEKYKQTTIPEYINLRLFKPNKELKIDLKDTKDVSGSSDDYSEWKNLFMDSDLVFYLVRADKLFQEDEKTKSRVREDKDQIRGWIKKIRPKTKILRWINKLRQPKRFFIIGTHCDLHPKLRQIRDDNKNDYLEQFKNIGAVNDMIQAMGGRGKVKVVLGSLENTDKANKLIEEIFSEFKK